MPKNIEGCLMRTSYEFFQLAREVLQTTPDQMEGLKLLPDEPKQSHTFALLHKRPFRGIVQWRGMGGTARPTRAPFLFENDVCFVRPGYWAEYQEVDEVFLRSFAQPGTHSAPIDLVEYERQLMFDISMKLHQLKELLIWQALTNGYVEERDENGTIVWSQRYRIIRARFAISACDVQNSTPLADLACIVNSVIGVSGARFDTDGAVMYANSRTWECLLRNQNPRDLGRMGQTACCDVPSLERLAQFFVARGLPVPRKYNGIWNDNQGRPQFYIPTGKIVIIGRRVDGQRLGAFYMPPTLIQAGSDTLGNHGTFVVRQDNASSDSRMEWRGKRVIRYTYGLEGIPVLEYPTSVIVVDTGCADCECTPLAEVCPQPWQTA
ncbi:MAG: hypothetical protein RML84_09245 [Anaerolineae bacterium]|nr:hypothetical protein [Anaerolineae bacterium]